MLGAELFIAGSLLVGLNGAATAHAAFPGLNGKIAFERGADVFAMNADGSGQTNLTRSPLDESEPAWSPDGKRIAFITGSYDTEVSVMNADGSGRANLTNAPGVLNQDPAWSPDGRRLAFSTRRDSLGSNSEIFVMNADGSGQTNLTNTLAAEGQPAWSPDGRRIAFIRGGYNSEIFAMNADGSGQTNLTNAPGVRNQDPAWSPDGRRIAFATRRDPRGGTFDIFVMNADGSGQVNLTNRQSTHDFGPAWSPSGTKIAYSGATGDIADIFVMTARGTHQMNLTKGHPGANPDWQALPPPQCRVPNVVGRALRAARTTIRHANCSVGRIRYARSTRARGRVVRQSPRPGARLRRGAYVNLVVSRGRR